jgi:hypothetical protein
MNHESKLYELYDVTRTYIRYVILHRWHKLTPRHFRFIEDAGWVGGSKLRQRVYDKMKQLNSKCD